MGWLSDALNEEFVIGRNVKRYEEDPDSLDDILNEQRARGFGSERGLREHARAVQAEEEGRLVSYSPSAPTARERLVTMPARKPFNQKEFEARKRAAQERRDAANPSLGKRLAIGLAVMFAGGYAGYKLSRDDDKS